MEYLPQYAEDIFSSQPAADTKESVDLLFAGNIGAAQSVDTIILAADILRDEAVNFHIVGSGSEFERLQQLSESKGLEKLRFYGRRPLDEMPEFYRKADAMLITLRADPIISCTLPGKVQSYMAAGKPIIGAIDGETARVIKDANCGFCGKAENPEELADHIKRFLLSPEKEALGKNSRNYYEHNFSRNKFFASLEKEFFELFR